MKRFLDRGNVHDTMADLLLAVTSTVLCIVDEAGVGTALIVGFLQGRILTRFASVWSECML